MRKKLAVLMAAVILLTFTAAGPVAAQDGELDTFCLTEAVIFDLEEIGPGTVEIPFRLALLISLLAPDIITEGPCPEEDDDGGGGDGAAAAPLELTQETEQEAESGDIDQSFEVSQTGDNSNQCASPQGVANTGNPQNVIDLLQAASETDDFEFEEVGSDITVSPEASTTCDQQVNQAASASG